LFRKQPTIGHRLHRASGPRQLLLSRAEPRWRLS
jgi:hypothetical protein